MAVNPGYQPQYGGPIERQSRNDVLAALLLIIAGAAGVLQFFLEWQSVEGAGSVTGQDMYEIADGAGETLASISVLAVLIGGGLLVLLGLALLIPSRSRKGTGSVALILSLIMIAAAVYFLVESDADFTATTIGYFLFLGAGVVGLLGSLKAVAS